MREQKRRKLKYRDGQWERVSLAASGEEARADTPFPAPSVKCKGCSTRGFNDRGRHRRTDGERLRGIGTCNSMFTEEPSKTLPVLSYMNKSMMTEMVLEKANINNLSGAAARFEYAKT